MIIVSNFLYSRNERFLHVRFNIDYIFQNYPQKRSKGDDEN